METAITFLAGVGFGLGIATVLYILVLWPGTGQRRLRRRSEPRPEPQGWLIGPWELCQEHPHCLIQKRHVFSAIPTSQQPSAPTSSEDTEKLMELQHGKNGF